MDNTIPSIHLNVIDRIVNAINPRKGLERIRSRAALSALQTAGYITSKKPKRSMRGWFSFGKTADEDMVPELAQARADSRDLYMNSPLATGAIRRVPTNAVGSGLVLQSRIDRNALNLEDERADDIERQIEREFNLWAMSKNADASRMQNFYEIQYMTLFNVCLSGDVFVLPQFLLRKNFPYGLALKIIEADMCENPNGQPDQGNIVAGIETDENEAAVKYWFKRQRYNEFPNKWIDVDAYGERTGRRNVYHLLFKERPGQRRGMPMLTNVVESLKQLTRLSEAELMAAVVSSFFTVFIKSESPTTGGLAGSYAPGDQVVPTGSDGEPVNPLDRDVYEMGSGNMIELGTDEDIAIADAKRPNDKFEPFFLAITKQIGGALEIPHEQLILHFSSSYSAARAALLEAWKFHRMKRLWLTRNLNQPVYEEFLTEAVSIGRLRLPGFFEDPILKQAWCKSAWIGSGMGMIDPLKETKAAQIRTQEYFSTREDEYTSQQGAVEGNWESVAQRKQRENRLIGVIPKPPEGTQPEGSETETEDTLEELEDSQ